MERRDLEAVAGVGLPGAGGARPPGGGGGVHRLGGQEGQGLRERVLPGEVGGGGEG